MTGGGDPASMRKHSVVIAGHATSVSLENVFWDELRRIAERDGRSLAGLIAEIDEGREGNLSSALRVHVMQDLLARVGDEAD